MCVPHVCVISLCVISLCVPCDAHPVFMVGGGDVRMLCGKRWRCVCPLILVLLLMVGLLMSLLVVDRWAVDVTTC